MSNESPKMVIYPNFIITKNANGDTRYSVTVMCQLDNKKPVPIKDLSYESLDSLHRELGRDMSIICEKMSRFEPID